MSIQKYFYIFVYTNNIKIRIMARKNKNGVTRAWEKFHNKKKPKWYHIHHIDNNPKNNTKQNLYCCSKEEHVQLHLKHYEVFGDGKDLAAYNMLKWSDNQAAVYKRKVALDKKLKAIIEAGEKVCRVCDTMVSIDGFANGKGTCRKCNQTKDRANRKRNETKEQKERREAMYLTKELNIELKKEGKKKCTECKDVKLITEFTSSKQLKSGTLTSCKRCTADRSKCFHSR